MKSFRGVFVGTLVCWVGMFAYIGLTALLAKHGFPAGALRSALMIAGISMIFSGVFFWVALLLLVPALWMVHEVLRVRSPILNAGVGAVIVPIVSVIVTILLFRLLFNDFDEPSSLWAYVEHWRRAPAGLISLLPEALGGAVVGLLFDRRAERGRHASTPRIVG